MKSLICSLVLVLCSFFLRAQTTTLAYPVKTPVANGPTTEGVTNAMYGKFIIYSYDDTTSANADSYIKHQAFSFISTVSPIALWYRDLTNQIWLQLSVSGSPTVSSWLTRGNDLSGQSLPNRLGTKNGDLLNIITSDLIRMIIPAGGIVRSSSAQNKFLVIDTVGKEIYYTDGGGTIPTWQQTLIAGSTLTQNNDIEQGNKRLRFNNVGNGSRFYLAPTLAATSRFDITQKSSNGTDSVYFYLNKTGFSNAIDGKLGLYHAATGREAAFSTSVSGGTPVVLMKSTSTSTDLDYNVKIDGNGVNLYSQNAAGTYNSYILVYPDSITHNVYSSSDPTIETYLNLYRDSIYGSVNGKIILGSKWADQYADDSLFWRTTDRTGEIKIYPSEVKIYGGNNEVEVNNSGVILDGGTTATELRFLEGSAGGTNYTGFKAPALAGNTIYTLPTAFPAGTYLMQSSSAGVLSFIDPAVIPGTFALTNGNGTTAAGTAVNLGGQVNADVSIEDDGTDWNFDIGRSNAFGNIRMEATTGIEINGAPVQMNNYGAGAATFDASGNISSVSDIRLKNKRSNYSGGLKELMQINPIIYKWKPESGMETKHDYIGFSAQNIRSSLGEDAIGINKQGYLSIQDRAILAVAINAIQELKELNDKQQKEINNLKQIIKNK